MNFNIIRLCLVVVILTNNLFAKDIFIAAPYYGNICNIYTKGSLSLQDTQMMNGVYLQYINPENGQINLFLYQAPNVNYAKVNGLHGNADWYFGDGDKWVVGLGYDNIIIDMDAGSHIMGPGSTFKLYNDVKEVYVRFGKYISTGEWVAGLSTRFLPYIGYGTESIGGSATISPGPGLIRINSGENYPLAGINYRFNYHHFIDVDAKYMAMFQSTKTLNAFTFQANLYFTHNLGLTYQYKYMEQKSGKDIYSIAGIAFVL